MNSKIKMLHPFLCSKLARQSDTAVTAYQCREGTNAWTDALLSYLTLYIAVMPAFT